MTAAEVKAALRRRHPAESQGMVGPWTVLEEVFEIDLLAIGANARPINASRQVQYPRVGYEVKVSRGDMRSELLRPMKRDHARRFCSEFYFAVPKGLLKPAEVAYEEPVWPVGAFTRAACRYSYAGAETPDFRTLPGPCIGGKRQHAAIGPLREGESYRRKVDVKCEVCAGRGYERKSLVERTAPTLWIPADCGLVEVSARGCSVVRKSPVHEPPPITPYQLGTLIRWTSVRPDPRHERWWKAA